MQIDVIGPVEGTELMKCKLYGKNHEDCPLLPQLN